MAAQQIVILGGGFGGASAALQTRRLLDESHGVTLIDRRNSSHLCGMNPMLVVGEREPSVTTRSLGSLSGTGIEFHETEVAGIDLEAREVVTDEGAVPFDFLVVALGADYDWEAVPGSRAAHSFYSFDEAVHLRDQLRRLRSGTLVIAAARPPYKCPPAPFEMGLLVDWYLRGRDLRNAIELHVCIPEPSPMAVAGPDATARVGAALAERHVELHTSAGVTAVDGREAVLADGTTLEADLIVTVPVHKSPDIVRQSGLTADSGWVPVDRATLETSVSGVFAIGDVNTVPIDQGKALPKAGVFAAGQGETVGKVIASRIKEEAPPPPYDGKGHCFMALSGVEAATVGGTFLAMEGPRVALGQFSEEGMHLKEVFEEDWRRFIT